MILLISSLINAGILLCLSLLHFLWATGNSWQRSLAIPSSPNGIKLFKPRKLATAGVATGLLFFAMITLSSIGLFKGILSLRQSLLGNGLIGSLFLLRAIGDARYVGIFKKIRKTAFAKKDSQLFTPLCLLISGFAFLICYQLYGKK